MPYNLVQKCSSPVEGISPAWVRNCLKIEQMSMWFSIGTTKLLLYWASVDLKWVFISLASYRLSNNLDNGDDDLRFPCVKESCWIDWGPKMGAPIPAFGSSNPQGLLSLSIGPNERRGVIWLYSKAARLAKIALRKVFCLSGKRRGGNA